ncbi:F-box/LRR-repeat protein, partial [Trifolium medium]|nr:F-box/LRR-repeat protein [Trifolium medium]
MEDSAAIDRISNLPDDLLCHILSFLPIENAFSTTILSKRWAPLFRSLTSLHFDDESIHAEETLRRFSRFVDTIILSTKLIKTLHFTCGSIHWRDTRCNIDGLIESAKQHPVENLQFTSSTFLGVSSPPNIFTFSTLVF